MIKRLLKRFFMKLLKGALRDIEENQHAHFRSKFDLHPTFRFNGQNILFYGNGKIVIDENTYIGSYSTIQAKENQFVKIGKYCKISHNVRIYTSSYVADQNFDTGRELLIKSGDVQIGNGVWIGANVFINPGVFIDDNAVIGANSVVTKDVEKGAIMGGVPARLIRYKRTIA